MSSPPIHLPAEATDDLIYSARVGDLDALRADLAALSAQHQCPESFIVASAIDTEPEEEGGSGSCLLHFPAANGNIEILSHLLSLLTSKDASQPLSESQTTAILNHRNHAGNTPLHWAALNTHLECVKALVEAGADLTATNDAGLDAVFLAERADWGAQEENGSKGEQQEGEGEGQDGGESKNRPMTKGRQVVEWLLSSEKAAELESGVGESQGQSQSQSQGQEGST